MPVAASKRDISYMAELDARVAGIPCLIGVINYERHKGSMSYNAPSDLDYYGWTEVEFDVLDRRGRPAAWLERKLDAAERADIEELICDRLS